MSNRIRPLFAVFSKHLNISEKATLAGEHQKALVHMLIAACAADAAGTKESVLAGKLIVNKVIPKYHKKFDVNMDDVEMPNGWREELLDAIDAEQAASSAAAYLASMAGQPLQ